MISITIGRRFHFGLVSVPLVGFLPMATMTLKNVPQALYDLLKKSAERNQRSMNREAIVCLEQALSGGRIDVAEVLSRARALRGRTSGIFIRDSELNRAKREGRAR